MSKYSFTVTDTNKGTVCKDGYCYEDLDTSAVNSTWRAVQWNGTSGVAELCDGQDFNINTGEQALSSEAEIQALVNAWNTGYDREQQQIAADAQAQLDAQNV